MKNAKDMVNRKFSCRFLEATLKTQKIKVFLKEYVHKHKCKTSDSIQKHKMKRRNPTNDIQLDIELLSKFQSIQ